MSRSNQVRGRGRGWAAPFQAAALIVLSGIAAAAAARSLPPTPVPDTLRPAATAQMTSTDPIAVVGTLHPGLWEVRSDEDGGNAVQRLCIGDPALLIQLRHRRGGCGRLVVANDPGMATVQYSCPGAGWGRTTLRATGSDNVRIETQGIAGNAPFAFSAVGRRTGDCVATIAGNAH